MYDLSLSRGGHQFGACEVTVVHDPRRTELWRLLNGDAIWIDPRLEGGWWLHLEPRLGSVKRMRTELGPLLESMEACGVTSAGPRSYAAEGPFDAHLDALGVASADQYSVTKPGSICFLPYLPDTEGGGVVPVTGDALALWLGDWVSAPSRSDNVRKLRASGCEERHLFVCLAFLSPVAFTAADVLLHDEGALPTVPPNLPQGITHVWVAGLWNGGDLFGWSEPTGWTRSAKQIDV